MKTEQIFSDWISAVDLTKTRIVKFPSFIFLCGGPLSETPGRFGSCRDIFYFHTSYNNYSFSKDIVLVEEIFKYFDHSEYRNLLDFETDLAEISSLTVLFSESPGSIAELGCFSVMKNVQNKIIVVIHNNESSKESFIWRGPISTIQEIAERNKSIDPVTTYLWEREKDNEGFLKNCDFPDAIDLAQTIQLILKKNNDTKSLDKEKLGHVMMLVVGTLKIIQLATLEEIVFILEKFDIKYDSKKVKQFLSLLYSLDIIIIYKYRNYDFYICNKKYKDCISWRFNKNSKINDMERWSSEFTEFYIKNEQEKKRALSSYLRSTGQIGG